MSNNMQFKTQQEIYKALLAGEKIVHSFDGTIMHLSNGLLISEKGQQAAYTFYHPSEFSRYTEPKPKVVLYEYLIKNSSNHWHVVDAIFATDKEAKNYYQASEVKRTGRSFEVES